MNCKVILVFALILILFAVSGCQTVQGIGRDITWTGQAGADLMEEIFDQPSSNKKYSEYVRNRSRYDY